MQQVPLRFAVSWKHSSYLKYSLKIFIYSFFLSVFIVIMISMTIYSSSAIFPLWNYDFLLIMYLREPILYKPAGFFLASSPWESK